MQKIKTGKVVMKPKWEFVARKVGLEGSWLLVVGLVALGFASIMIFIKRYNPIEWAEFGEIGWRVFYEDFPYLWLLTIGMFLVGGMMLLVKIGDNYKKGLKTIGLITVVSSLILAMILFLFQS